MDLRSPGFVLLIWLPGVVLAQSPTQSCQAPRLDGGYFPSDDETYTNSFELFYACNNGRKPVGEGWWATSKCRNGTWVPKPQCIDVNNCFAPNIPNVQQLTPQSDWYNAEKSVRITCVKGYDPKPRSTTVCRDGNWTYLLACEKKAGACSTPSKIPHAVIINQQYKEVFDEDSEVQYECEDGYTVEGADSIKSIWCIAGNWTVGPSCNKAKKTDVGQGGSTGGGHATSVGRETQPESGGSSTSSGSNKGERQITRISNCGRYPSIQNGDVVETHAESLRYQCNSFYRLVGADVVVCYSDGEWSEVPTCKAAFCSLNTEEHPELTADGVKHIKDGESMQVKCTDVWVFDNYVVARCTNGKLSMTRCCNKGQIATNMCQE